MKNKDFEIVSKLINKWLSVKNNDKPIHSYAKTKEELDVVKKYRDRESLC